MDTFQTVNVNGESVSKPATIFTYDSTGKIVTEQQMEYYADGNEQINTHNVPASTFSPRNPTTEELISSSGQPLMISTTNQNPSILIQPFNSMSPNRTSRNEFEAKRFQENLAMV